MGMQISSLSLGQGAPPELQREKTVAMEQRPSGQQELSIAGAKRAEAVSVEARTEAARAGAPDLEQTKANLEQLSIAFSRSLRFDIDQESREITVKVIDTKTDKVIKVLPPEELKRLNSDLAEFKPKGVEALRETAGFLFDETV
jgi:flagellar protein FlaG